MSGTVFDQEAIERAAELRAWVRSTVDAIRDIAMTQQYVTVLDIWARISWPPHSDGRQMGKAIRLAMSKGLIEKAKRPDGIWLARDQIDFEPARTRDGDLVPSKSLIPLYRSLLVERPAGTPLPEVAASRPPEATSG